MTMPTLHSLTHCQATQANATTKACQRVCLSERTRYCKIDRQNDKKQ